MSLSDLSDPDFQYDRLSVWPSIYQAIEKRYLATTCARNSPTAWAFDPAADLRLQAEGYNLQVWVASAVTASHFNHWIAELQTGAVAAGAVQAGGAPLWPASPHPTGYSGSWLDGAAPIVAGGYNFLNVTTKTGLHGEWRRKRPREIAGAAATVDRFGNNAVPGQRAYLWGGSLFGGYEPSDGTIYRCVASGNWVVDLLQPGVPPDELDSDNAPSTNNFVPYGTFSQGDYIGPHLFDELGRRLLALLVTASEIQEPSVIAGQGTSDRQVPVPPGDDPTATATAFEPDEGTAVSKMDSDWHTTATPPTTGGASNWAFVWNAQMNAMYGTDDFGNDGYSISGLRNYPDGGRLFTTLAGTMYFVWHDTTHDPFSAGASWDFDAQGTGLSLGGWVVMGSTGFSAAPDGTTPVPVSYGTNAATPTASYNSPPVPGTATTKGCVFKINCYTVWDLG